METKSTTASPELANAFDDFLMAFEQFKDVNDQRLDEIERRSADPLTDEKLKRVNDALDQQQATIDELALKGARPQLATSAVMSATERQHKSAFESYVRAGETANLRMLEGKALSVSSDADGGYLVPAETERAVMSSLKDISPLRAICGNRQVSGAVYKKPFTVSGPGTGWVGETDARVESASPTLAELTFPTMELYAMPAATQTLLDDSAVDIDSWIAEEVRAAFAEQESAAFVNGDGVNKPAGFLTAPTVDNASHSWGNIGTVSTGADGGFDASAPADVLLDTIYAVKSGYRANAHFVMNRATQAEIRKIKDADGNYIWQPAANAGTMPTLFNHPVAEVEDMPDIASGSHAIAFGDFNRGYLIVDRIGLRVLRDPYSSKPYVLFYTTKRVGGGVQDFHAIKLVKFA